MKKEQLIFIVLLFTSIYSIEFWLAFEQDNCFSCWSARSSAYYCNINQTTGYCCRTSRFEKNCSDDSSRGLFCSNGYTQAANKYDTCIRTTTNACGTNNTDRTISVKSLAPTNLTVNNLTQAKGYICSYKITATNVQLYSNLTFIEIKFYTLNNVDAVLSYGSSVKTATLQTSTAKTGTSYYFDIKQTVYLMLVPKSSATNTNSRVVFSYRTTDTWEILNYTRNATVSNEPTESYAGALGVVIGILFLIVASVGGFLIYRCIKKRRRRLAKIMAKETKTKEGEGGMNTMREILDHTEKDEKNKTEEFKAVELDPIPAGTVGTKLGVFNQQRFNVQLENDVANYDSKKKMLKAQKSKGNVDDEVVETNIFKQQ